MSTSNPLSQPTRYSSIEKANRYDEAINQAKGARKVSHWLETRAVLRALTHVSGGSVLDCPCGTGRIDAVLRDRFRTVVGVDSSESMLTIYRQGNPLRVGHLGDAFALPFKDGEFDWVVSHRLLHHFTEDAQRIALLKSLSRVSKDGVVIYAWLDTPFRTRRNSRRQTLPLSRMLSLLEAAGLQLEAKYFAAWPFQPKAVLVCRKVR